MDVQAFIKFDPKTQRLICSGDWNLANLRQIKKQFKKIILPKEGNVIIDGSEVTILDSAGAWLIISKLKSFSANHLIIELQNFSPEAETLLKIVEKRFIPPQDIPHLQIPNILARVGATTSKQLGELFAYLSFIGGLSLEFIRVFFRPSHWRWNSLASVIDNTGYRALPIIALLSFMIGVVISYQMGNQLRSYGANVFIVDLLGLSVLREFGPLITAIMVAGRTGSAFTAQLGIMKINQEIDALNVMGVTPAELLLLPRIFGLLITLPLLTMWANVFGIIGGMVMANSMLSVTPYDFLQRFQQEIPLRSLFIGLGKAPVFALVIASIGCFEGMRVEGSAASVGRLTTKSVVLSIFFIIVADAIFSVIFSKFKL